MFIYSMTKKEGTVSHLAPVSPNWMNTPPIFREDIYHFRSTDTNGLYRILIYWLIMRIYILFNFCDDDDDDSCHILRQGVSCWIAAYSPYSVLILYRPSTQFDHLARPSTFRTWRPVRHYAFSPENRPDHPLQRGLRLAMTTTTMAPKSWASKCSRGHFILGRSPIYCFITNVERFFTSTIRTTVGIVDDIWIFIICIPLKSIT